MSVEVTIPLMVTAIMSFEIDADTPVNDALIASKIAEAQRIIDRRGNDLETGIYFVIDNYGEPTVYDPRKDD